MVAACIKGSKGATDGNDPDGSGGVSAPGSSKGGSSVGPAGGGNGSASVAEGTSPGPSTQQSSNATEFKQREAHASWRAGSAGEGADPESALLGRFGFLCNRN